MTKNIIVPTEMVYYDTATLDPVTYGVINNYGFEGPCLILRLVNASDSLVIISYDGATDHEYIPTYSETTLNFKTNNGVLKNGTKLYARGTTGKFGGYVYVTGYYEVI